MLQTIISKYKCKYHIIWCNNIEIIHKNATKE